MSLLFALSSLLTIHIVDSFNVTDFLDHDSKLLMISMNESSMNSILLMGNKEIIQAINDFEYETEVRNIFKNLHKSLEPSQAYYPWLFISMLVTYLTISFFILCLIVKTWCQRHKKSIQE